MHDTLDRDPSMEFETPAGLSTRMASPLEIVWRRKTLVALGVVVGLALGALYYSRKSPVYQATAQILVVKKRAESMAPVGPGGFQPMYVEDYLTTHVILIRSQEILRRAGAVLNDQAPGVLPPGADPVAFIGAGLTVTREGREGAMTAPNVLNLAFRCGRAEDCPRVLNAVIEAYTRFLNETYGDLNKEFVQQMTKAQETLQNDIAAKQKEHDKIADSVAYALKSKDGLSSIQERINKLDGKEAELLLRQTEIKNRREVIAKALKDGQSRSAILRQVERASAAEKAPGAPEKRTVEETLALMEAQEQDLIQDHGKDHPVLIDHRRRMQAMRDRIKDSARAAPGAAKADDLDLYLQTMDLEYEENKMLLTALTGLLTTDREQAMEQARELLREEKARKAIEPYQQLYDSILGRMQQIKLTPDADRYLAQAISSPGAGAKVAPSLLQSLAVSVALGLIGGLGLAYAAEWTDKSFHSPEEVRRRLGLPIVGHIPFIEPQPINPNLDPRLCVLQRPRSAEAESFRGLRTALYFSTQGRGRRIIQVTSPNMGDGKSTLVANLAVAIAQTGKSVALIDADFRRPRVHRFFRLANSAAGLATVVSGESTVEEAIQPGPVPGLSLIPCGPRPANPAELLTSPKFQEMLADLGKRFDFVLIDTPPLLGVSDPAVVAPRVDGVLLAIRLTRRGRPVAERAKEVLHSLGANVLGVVVNGFDLGQAGKYGYAYGYDYQYQYSYEYADHDHDSDAVPIPAAPSANGTHKEPTA